MADIIYKVNITSLEAIDKYMFEKYGGPIPYSWFIENWDQLPKMHLRDDTPFIPTYIQVETGIKNTSGLNLSDLDHKHLKAQQNKQQQRRKVNDDFKLFLEQKQEQQTQMQIK